MTSYHEGISCNVCKKKDFKGLRFKCLICLDFDLCPNCHENGLISSSHSVEHPMQCIITKDDYDLFYSGETVVAGQSQSLTCPLCGTLGFSHSDLLEHVTVKHGSKHGETNSPTGVVCPICGPDSDQLVYDLGAHLNLEHRNSKERQEPVVIRGRGGRTHARSSGPRGRRFLSHYNTSMSDQNDHIIEMIAQLTALSRTANSSSGYIASQLHQLQVQLQSSPSSPARTNNDNEVRIMRRTFQNMNNQLNSTSSSTNTSAREQYYNNQPYMVMEPNLSTKLSSTSDSVKNPAHRFQPDSSVQSSQKEAEQSNQYLLSWYLNPTLTEAEKQEKETLKADKGLFVQELLHSDLLTYTQ